MRKETKRERTSQKLMPNRILMANKAKEGDHLVVFWDEGSDRLWYLGVVEQVLASGEIRVNHFKRANRQDYRNWYMPEEKDVETVSEDQVLAKNLNVLYPLSDTRVRCIITQDIVDMINEKIDNL